MMTLTRSSKLVVPLGLALLAGCVTASLADAQSAHVGKFTLPLEARWGHVVLPPGEYSFALDRASGVGRITLRAEPGGYVAQILNQGISDQPTLDHSELILVRSGGTYTIRALRLAELGMTFEYTAPKTERQMISQGPQLLERISVIMGG